jgi:hypothetical protein
MHQKHCEDYFFGRLGFSPKTDDITSRSYVQYHRRHLTSYVHALARPSSSIKYLSVCLAVYTAKSSDAQINMFPWNVKLTQCLTQLLAVPRRCNSNVRDNLQWSNSTKDANLLSEQEEQRAPRGSKDGQNNSCCRV